MPQKPCHNSLLIIAYLCQTQVRRCWNFRGARDWSSADHASRLPHGRNSMAPVFVLLILTGIKYGTRLWSCLRPWIRLAAPFAPWPWDEPYFSASVGEAGRRCSLRHVFCSLGATIHEGPASAKVAWQRSVQVNGAAWPCQIGWSDRLARAAGDHDPGMTCWRCWGTLDHGQLS